MKVLAFNISSNVLSPKYNINTVAFQHNLRLIRTVNNNYRHIEELETLVKLFYLAKAQSLTNEYRLGQRQIDRLEVICKTTQNSHYNYGLFTSSEYQNPDNHIEKVIIDLKIKD